MINLTIDEQETLLKGIAKGDNVAYITWWNYLKEDLLKIAYSWVAPRHGIEADDLMQLFAMELKDVALTYDSTRGNPVHWTKLRCRTTASDYYSFKRIQKRDHSKVLQLELEMDGTGHKCDIAPGPDTTTTVDTLDLVANFLDKIHFSPIERVVMYELLRTQSSDFNFVEIGRNCDLSYKAVDNAVSRIKRKIKDYMTYHNLTIDDFLCTK